MGNITKWFTNLFLIVDWMYMNQKSHHTYQAFTKAILSGKLTIISQFFLRLLFSLLRISRLMFYRLIRLKQIFSCCWQSSEIPNERLAISIRRTNHCYYMYHMIHIYMYDNVCSMLKQDCTQVCSRLSNENVSSAMSFVRQKHENYRYDAGTNRSGSQWFHTDTESWNCAKNVLERGKIWDL